MVRRLVWERRGHGEVDICLVDQFAESNKKTIEKLVVVVEGFPKLVDARMEIGFCN